jgi:methyl-accepting chemotaxis protein
MPDDLSNRGPADPSRINLTDPDEVQYWADKFNVSKERLSLVVRRVGHSVDAVSRALKSSSD